MNCFELSYKEKMYPLDQAIKNFDTVSQSCFREREREREKKPVWDPQVGSFESVVIKGGIIW